MPRPGRGDTDIPMTATPALTAVGAAVDIYTAPAVTPADFGRAAGEAADASEEEASPQYAFPPSVPAAGAEGGAAVGGVSSAGQSPIAAPVEAPPQQSQQSKPQQSQAASRERRLSTPPSLARLERRQRAIVGGAYVQQDGANPLPERPPEGFGPPAGFSEAGGFNGGLGGGAAGTAGTDFDNNFSQLQQLLMPADGGAAGAGVTKGLGGAVAGGRDLSRGLYGDVRYAGASQVCAAPPLPRHRPLLPPSK